MNTPAAGDMTFTTSGGEAMRIDADTGYIGIATAAPTTALEVVGTVSATHFVGDGSGLTNISAGGGDGGGRLLAVLEDQKGATDEGGDCYSGAWRIRDLNAEVFDPTGIVSISSNTFTPTVDGWVEWFAAAFRLNENQTRLYNVTDGVVVAAGTRAKANRDGNADDISSGGGPVTADKTYRLEHRCQTTDTFEGFGDGDTNFGVNNVFSRIKLYSLSSSGTGVCASGWSMYGSKCYFVSSGTAPWWDARTACQGMSANLVRIDDASENTFVDNLTGANFWINARDNDVEGEWRWKDNNDLFWLGASGGSAQNGLYTNWSSGEPNNFDGNEDCANMRDVSDTWNDSRCNTNLTYVCERDL